MNPTHLEFNTASELVAYAVDKLDPYTLEEDLDAAVVAVLVTAIETATYRQLKPIDQLFMEKK